MNRAVVIADASCLIALENINEIEILAKLFECVYVTPEVASEVGSTLPEWIQLRSLIDQERFVSLRAVLDVGEAASIALALETPHSLLIIDEKKGRSTAIRLGLEIIGTVGVIIRAIDSGLIKSPGDIADRLELVGFRISADLRKEISDRRSN